MNKNEMDLVRDRAVTLMKELCAAYGRYKWLENRTGIPAQKWANFYNNRQQLTVEMIVGLAKLAPENLEWLLLGGVSSGIQINHDDNLGSIKHLIWKMEVGAELQKKAESSQQSLENMLLEKSREFGKDEVEKIVNKIFK